MGLLLQVKVTPANLGDRDGARQLFQQAGKALDCIEHFWADSGYAGEEFIIEMIETFGHYLEIVSRIQPEFVVQPKRWIVERTFAWLGRNRRLSKDYEGLPSTTETWCYLAMSKLMLRRLTA